MQKARVQKKANVQTSKQRRVQNNNNNMKQQSLKVVGAAYSRPIVSISPKEKRSANGTRTLVFKEYVQDILGSVAFSATAYPVNPGVPTLFAWLSNQALMYQEYRFKKLRFLFETEKGSSTNGKVLFAFQPDPADSLPVSKQEMLENQFKAGGAPWEPFNLNCNMVSQALGARRFIRNGTLASNLDIKTYDVGQLIVAVQGMADASAVGELYAEYEVELITPVVSSTALSQMFSKGLFQGSASAASFLGTTPTLSGGNLDVSGTVNTITFNRVGRFAISMNIFGTGLFTALVPVTSASTGTVTFQAGISNAAANLGTEGLVNYSITITERGQTAVFVFTTVSTTVTTSNSRISGYSN